MHSIKTNGIVLKRINFGEADRILTILTERFGKIKAIAKGVRKTKSKLAGSLEPFMNVDLQLCEGKTFYIVTGAAISEEFPKIHSDLIKTSHAFYIGELLDKFLQENQKVSAVFEIFLDALKTIEEEKGEFLLRIFELRIIEACGFHPELFECVHCRQKLIPGNNFWDSVEGGVICTGCQQKYHHGRKISDELIKIFRLIEQGQFELIGRLKCGSLIKREAEEILAEYLESILERAIKSKSFLNLVNKS